MASDPSSIDGTDALRRLLEGNRRFVGGSRLDRDLAAEVAAGASGQAPFAAIVGCIDSRAAAELVFDVGVGDVFDIRLAGAIVDDVALGSLEYACGVAGARLLLVLGHTGCGAVKAACDHAASGGGELPLPHLHAVVEPILEAVAAETETTDDRTSGNDPFVDRVAELNVHRTMLEIRDRSDVLDDLVERGEVTLVGAMYDVRSGVAHVVSGP